MERNKRIRKGKEKGITLIALVVTIIILIILATISVNMIFSENGLIATSKEAKEHQANATVSEQAELDKISEEAANIIAGGGTSKPGSPAGEVMDKPDGWKSEKVTPISDGSGNAIPLPNGFYYVGGDIKSGLVISDKEGDTMDAVFPDSGNQFVWIPVNNEESLTRTEFDETTGQPSTEVPYDYEEPTMGYPNEKVDFNTMKEQVLKYGGFYIGRYEAGDADSSTTLRTKTTIDHTMVSKKGVAPYSHIPWGKDFDDVDSVFVPYGNNPDNVEAHGAVYLSKHMYDGKEQAESVVSTLCYGSQWDAMCRYIGDSNRKTSKKSEPKLTGSVPTDISKNIYDLAGNCGEWTMEYYLAPGIEESRRVLRGISYSYKESNLVSSRSTDHPAISDGLYCFRVALFIK